MVRATIITDASFCHKTKASGWAAWVRIDGCNYPIKRYGEFKTEINTPTEAELYAALNGLWLAKQHGATRFLLQSDCMGVINAVNGDVKKNGITIKSYRRALNNIGIHLGFVSGKHVKGHTVLDDARSFVNRWCDQMARKTMKEQRV